MKTSREQFEEWFYEYTGCDPKDSRYVNMVEMYWMAWQASREVIEVELPSKKHEIKISGAIAVYEGKATCEKALDQWVCNVRRN